MLILIGKSGSGKDTIAKELQGRGWNRIVTDTTRKPRSYENDGIDYNFISEEKFSERSSINYYIEMQEYIMADGNHVKYGTPNCTCGEKDFVIMSPRSFREIRNKVQSFAIYLYANDSTIKDRLFKRGDNKDEVLRRMTKDSEDFKGIENEVDKIVYNNVGYDIKEIADKIEKIVTEKNEMVNRNGSV